MINMKPHGKIIGGEHLPPLEHEKAMNAPADTNDTVLPLQVVVDDAERKAVVKALQVSEGNRENAARLLDIALRNLYYKIKNYDLH